MPENQSYSPNTVRLNRFIAQCGVASRRKADELIENGQVTVNGHRITEHGRRVNPLKDHVKVGRKLIRPEQEKEVYMFHKPPRVLTTLEDPEGRPTVADYFKKTKTRLFPVGRLDWDSEGLLVMTKYSPQIFFTPNMKSRKPILRNSVECPPRKIWKSFAKG